MDEGEPADTWPQSPASTNCMELLCMLGHWAPGLVNTLLNLGSDHFCGILVVVGEASLDGYSSVLKLTEPAALRHVIGWMVSILH